MTPNEQKVLLEPLALHHLGLNRYTLSLTLEECERIASGEKMSLIERMRRMNALCDGGYIEQKADHSYSITPKGLAFLNGEASA